MKLMVLDGNSVINRAYYGVRALTTRDGFFTNAIYGFLNILEKLRADEKPDALCVAFDLKAPTFRHLKYDGYKATRHPMPDELAMQMPVMKDVLRAMRIPIFECEGWEADDVIGTIGKRCGHAGWDCVIVTGDRDSLQLIDEHVTVKLVSSKLSQTVAVNYDPAKFREEYGFEPIHLIDLKALMGDSSDNIPGVAGVGPKTATQLLLDYGTLDGVYAHLDAVKEKLRAKLEQGRDSAYLSYDLATIRCEAPIEFSPEACLVQPYDEAALYELFARLEFTRLIARYGLHAPQETAENGMIDGVCTSEVVSDAARAETLAASFQKEHYVNLIAEPDLSAIAVNTDESGYYFCGDALESTKFMSTLFGVSVKKVTHDCKPLMRRLLEVGYPAESFIFDTALAAYDLDATQGSYDLDRVVTHLLGFEIGRADKDEVGEEAARVCNRLAEASAVAALYKALPEKLAQNGMEKLYYEIELPLCRVLAEMEYAGVKADQMALISFGNMLQSRIEAAQQTIFAFAGREFNINSTKQLGEILFDELGLPAGKKTKSGYSTNADVLEKLRWEHPIVADVLQYRQYAKLKSTYCDGLLKVIGPDGRVRTSFQMTVTATGRLSSTEPNLQNIPTRTPLGSELRRMFVPERGNVLVDADYSQIELRLLAHIAGDETMRQAFLSGEDIHTVTASQVFGVPTEAVTKQMRSHAKAVNFGIVYGISAFSLAQDIGVSVYEAKEYIQNYLDRFSGVRRYMTEIVEKAKAQGYVETLMHRRRDLPELTASNFATRSFGERVALNMPIQGTAADVMKLAMVRVHDRLRREAPEAKLLLQVHDELIVECPEAMAEQAARLLTEEMEGVMQLSVPLVAEAHWGKNWLEAKG